MNDIRAMLLLCLSFCVGTTGSMATVSQNKAKKEAVEHKSLRAGTQEQVEQTTDQPTPTTDDSDRGGVSLVTGVNNIEANSSDVTDVANEKQTKGTKIYGQAGVMLSLFEHGKSGSLGLIVGVDGELDLNIGAKQEKFRKHSISVRKRGGFGLAPRLRYKQQNTTDGYVSFGVLWTRYRTGITQNKKAAAKSAMYVGLGIEKEMGALVVRGEVDRILGRRTIKLSDNQQETRSPYVLKVGGSYKF